MTFTIFNNFKSYSDKSLPGNMWVGALAGCSTTIAFHPLTFARTRIGVDIGNTSSDRQFNNFFDWVSKIVKSDGIRGIYRGLGMSLILTAVNKSTYFGLFESGKIHFDKFEDKSHHIPLLWLFASGTTAVGYILCYPFDTLRRRMMMQSGRKDIIYLNYSDCFKKIYRKEGTKGFFKGITPQLMKSFGTSVFLVVNDRVQKHYK